MGSITVKKFKHKEDEHRYKVTLELDTEDSVVAESSYKYLIDVAKGMEKVLTESPLKDILDIIRGTLDKEGD